ncbi:DUF5132 domain-containing protein [Thiosocius teredinicola]|uniref:DUF5132 domain-containing protein n=1 Tax=Thiosocius teredinicola TaxID=1973002 RepID=UPI000990CE0E
MAIGDLGKTELAKGVALGAGLALLVPLAVVTLAPLARPVLRQALKSGMLAYEKGREFIDEMSETFEDTAAEVQAELREARARAATAEPIETGSETPPDETEQRA